MSPPARIRLGIIGCGRVAWERHFPAIRRIPEFDVAAVADPVEDRRNHIAGLFAARDRYADARSIFDRQDIHAVAVLTPTPSHAALSEAAMQSGKHLFLEKPIAMTAEECDRLIRARNASSRTACLCFNLRWHRLVRQARNLLASGVLGRIKSIRSVYSHNRPGDTAPDWHKVRALGGGVTFNEAVHHYDLWRYLLGAEVVTVSSANLDSDFYDDETSVLSARLSGNVLATGVFTYCTGPNSELEIYGHQGRLVLSLYRFDGLEYFPRATYAGDLAHRGKGLLRAVAGAPAILSAYRRGGDFQATFEDVWRHFLACVTTGARPECTLEDGKQALVIALAAMRSSESGIPVCLESAPDS